MALLDPKLDVVFKMLFTEPANEKLLLSLLEAVLRPSSPIAHVRVVDGELPKDLVSDRGLRLDVLVELADGRVVDVEMECDLRRALGERWLYHWARLFGARIRRGDRFDRLTPVVCVVFLAPRARTGRFHSVYRVLEVHDHETLCDALELHVVQLPRVEQARAEGEGVLLQRWARFLRFDSEKALQSLAQEDRIMAEAKSALEILSREPSAQRIAEMRRDAKIERRLDRAADRAEGLREGEAKGLREGKTEGLREGKTEGLREGEAKGLREAVRTACELLGIALDEARERELAGVGEGGLRALLAHLKTARAWP